MPDLLFVLVPVFILVVTMLVFRSIFRSFGGGMFGKGQNVFDKAMQLANRQLDAELAKTERVKCSHCENTVARADNCSQCGAPLPAPQSPS